jgi:NADH-quinone oxidoreductase subunit G
MPQIFIDGQPVQARSDQTVLQAALENGFFIPRLCWHPQLSIAGNCRICTVQVEGRSWVEIACNMPVAEGLKVLTDSEIVRENRKATMQFLTLNHPVDCGVCDKAGECTLQDYHVAFNGTPSVSHDAKVHATKFYELSERITLDNERCILCSRCVRFTREISRSNALGIVNRGDHSLVRPAGDRPLDDDPYSDNIVDICPVGALLSKSFLYKSRVWYLKATPSVCPGCERGCNIDLWHRKPEWFLRSLDKAQNVTIERITPRENAAVNGPWVCNKARDLAKTVFERPRAAAPMRKGREVPVDEALGAARALLAKARHPVALVSSAGSNEELQAFQQAFAERMHCFVKTDSVVQPGEPVADELLIRADKNPNRYTARALFGDAPIGFPPETDLVVVWGEGFAFTELPRGVPVIFLNAFLAPENGHADVFFPLSLQTERSGSYTNFQGITSRFEACFPKPASVVDAQTVFGALTLAQAVAP